MIDDRRNPGGDLSVGMSKQSANTLVLVTGGLLFAFVALKRDKISDPFKFAWAAGVITLGLSVVADLAPEIAGPFALLLLMAVYWKNRGVLGGVLSGTGLPAGVTSTGSSAAETAASPGRSATP